MTRLYFVRHANAYDEMGFQFNEYPLNNYGKVEALQLGKRLRNNTFTTMYCSKIKRAMETAEIVNEIHKMDIIYDSNLNEVANEEWPQPGVLATLNRAVLEDYNHQVKRTYSFYRKIIEENREPGKSSEVIVFTHGNWIRVLLTKILCNGDPQMFPKFVIHNSSLTIIDVDDNDHEFVITVADAAHTQLYESKI